MAFDNRASALWATVTNLAVLNDGADPDIVTNITGNLFLPKTPEQFGYDPDGNLTSDGRWTYLWDGENRLVEMVRDTSTPTLSSRLRLGFEYDRPGRRIRKQFYTHHGSGWVERRDTVCLYDGWNGVAELDAHAGLAWLRAYVWGSDLSGSLPDGPNGAGAWALAGQGPAPEALAQAGKRAGGKFLHIPKLGRPKTVAKRLEPFAPAAGWQRSEPVLRAKSRRAVCPWPRAPNLGAATGRLPRGH